MALKRYKVLKQAGLSAGYAADMAADVASNNLEGIGYAQAYSFNAIREGGGRRDVSLIGQVIELPAYEGSKLVACGLLEEVI